MSLSPLILTSRNNCLVLSEAIKVISLQMHSLFSLFYMQNEKKINRCPLIMC